ncbi:unnamed protein product [Ilex paraguariensis]|uniref:Uncharacterized protein n=1 Tax=Ilex paraguariensis TaxID=185542 RepID=A0ABC8QNB9_9AQUA
MDPSPFKPHGLDPKSTQIHQIQTPKRTNRTASFRSSHHRRAQSEVNFRLPEDLDLVSDPFDAVSGSFDEIGSEDDLFSTYMDIEKLGSNLNDGVSDNAVGGGGTINCGGVAAESREERAKYDEASASAQ